MKRKTVTICATLTAGVLGLVMWIVIHRGGEDGPLARPDLVENEHPGRSEVAEASDATRFMPEDEPALAHYDTPCADRVVGIVVDEAYQPLEGAAVAASLVPLSTSATNSAPVIPSCGKIGTRSRPCTQVQMAASLCPSSPAFGTTSKPR